MLKRNKEFQLSGLQISILHMISLIIGIVGIIICSILKKQFNISIWSLLLVLSCMECIFALLYFIVSVSVKITMKIKLKELYTVKFTAQNDTFKHTIIVLVMAMFILISIIVSLI